MRIQIVGAGRMGAALSVGLRADPGLEIDGPLGRGATGAGADVVLLAVPDAAIADAASGILPGPIVGHLSGMTGLAPLAPHEAFSLHPLLSVTGPDTRFAGAHAAIDGSSARARGVAERLADVLGLTAFRVADGDRAAYHAAASLAANALVALEWTAERLAATAGVPRAALAPLARAALENWADRGAPAALTGPIARGDESTVARQRAAVAERLPAELALFDALADTTRALAAARRGRTAGAPPAPAPTAVNPASPEASASPAPSVSPAPPTSPEACASPDIPEESR